MKNFCPGYYKILVFIFAFASAAAFSQTDSGFSNTSIKKVKVIPGKQYDISSFSEFFSGEHWRDLWATKIDAEVLDLNTFGGGLTPTKKGGGLQTKSLRLKGNDGNEYKFRSMNKDPTRSLPPELQNSYYADLIQDQVSIGLPGSSLITYPLMKETGILSVEPKIVMMPDDVKLGVFQKDFGNVLGVIEINPRAGKKTKNNFEGADKVVNGFEIFEVTEKDNDERVDQKEFLKARLMDVFLGDRDRHADQWQWAGYKQDGNRIWKPIPRDRDYAFGRYDGLFPSVSGWFAHSLVGFSEDYPQLVELTWSGRHLDRRFLNELEKKDWDSIANFLKSKLTNEVIMNAVRQMPPEMFAKKGMTLFKMLENRRNHLKDASDEFFEVYSNVVDVYGSNKKEYADVSILNEKELRLELFESDKESGKKKKNPFYSRKFNSDQTSEVRLNLLNGDDLIDVKGKGKYDNPILLRLVSGDGNDELINKSTLPIKLYDSQSNTKIISAKGIYFNNDKIQIPLKEIDRYEPSVDDRYGFWAFVPVLNFNTDDGWILGGGPSFVKFGFRANPYLYYLQLTGAYATTAKDYDVRFYGDFNKLIHNSRVEFFLSASQLDFNRYYGTGNETVRIDSLANANFYKTNQEDIRFEPKVSVNISKAFRLNFSARFRYSNVKPSPDYNTLVQEEKPYGFGKIAGLSAATGFTYDTRDNLLMTKKGIYANVFAGYYPKLLDYKFDFSKIGADLIGYFTLTSFTEFNLMLRAGGEKIFGTYPFYEAATVGGLKNLRGFSRDRFQGDASVFGQSELRIKLANVNLLLPGEFGIMGIADVGRVFVENEDSKKWHSTYGGGAWFKVINAVVMNFLIARSAELTKYYFSFGVGI